MFSRKPLPLVPVDGVRRMAIGLYKLWISLRREGTIRVWPDPFARLSGCPDRVSGRPV